MTDNVKAQILCIDDEADILEALQRTLRRRFEVFCAQSAQEAETLLKQNPSISVIICDHFLGTETGVELLARAQKIAPLTSRVLLSGQIELKSLEEAINSAKIHKFVTKPWENDQLLLQVIEAYKTHKQLVEQEQLKILSITDPVTSLTNHRFFQEKIRLDWEKSQRNKQPLSLIMIDIDHFKKFNDRFGHPEGDRYLAHVAQTLKEACPSQSSLSRYGGEEFAVILPNTDSEQALKVAEALRQGILNSNYNNYPLSISLGVATHPDHASSVNELILSADQSLYQAKRRGRNQTVVGLVFDD
jgi:two-component system, cell cycle response regulator